jgi:hypothetical protein
MDRASQALVLDLPPGMPDTYAARAEHGQVPLSTLHHRAKGRRSIEEKAQSQQYLTQCEEKALIKDFCYKWNSELGYKCDNHFIVVGTPLSA